MKMPKLSNSFLLLLAVLAFYDQLPAQKNTDSRDKTESVITSEAEVIWQENAELTTKNITQTRNISEYDEGGYFDCRGWKPKDSPQGKCDEEKVRDFIWKHWSDKTKGYVRITYNSVDATSTSHIFVEPGKDGIWHLSWRIVRSHAIAQLNRKIDDIIGIVILERVLDKPAKGKWALVFKNESGNRLGTMPYFYK